jgi:hypothetical protein
MNKGGRERIMEREGEKEGGEEYGRGEGEEYGRGEGENMKRGRERIWKGGKETMRGGDTGREGVCEGGRGC